MEATNVRARGEALCSEILGESSKIIAPEAIMVKKRSSLLYILGSRFSRIVRAEQGC
jgi:hypothetical protein